MILPFSTKINGKPTYFVEKIWRGLLNKNFNLLAYHRFKNNAADEGVIDDWNWKEDLNPKIHTIREDKNNRWKVGTKIDFFINCRQKNMFRFAPVLSVVSVQKVLMTYAFNDVIQISVDDKELFSYIDRLEFAQNDGFDTWEDFFNFFYSKIKESPKQIFKGKLIHWTGHEY